MRGRKPIRELGLAVAACLLAVAATAGGALAARAPLIVIEIDLDTGTETFTTNTPLLCPEGDAFTDFHFGSGNFGAAGVFHLEKLLVCADGSGSFVIRLDAASNFVVGNGTNGGWSLVPGSGTDDYVGLKGGGHVVGVNQDDPVIDLIDSYSGSLRI